MQIRDILAYSQGFTKGLEFFCYFKVPMAFLDRTCPHGISLKEVEVYHVQSQDAQEIGQDPFVMIGWFVDVQLHRQTPQQDHEDRVFDHTISYLGEKINKASRRLTSV